MVGPTPEPPAERASRAAGLSGSGWWVLRRKGDTTHLTIRNNIGVVGRGVTELIAELDGAAVIELHIDSRGGDGRSAVMLYHAIGERCATATIQGFCCSAAFPIALAATHRRMANDAHMMVHAPQNLILGNASELRAEAKRSEELEIEFARILRDRNPQSAEQIARWLSADTWLNAEQAQAAGLVHEIFAPAQPFTGDKTNGQAVDVSAQKTPDEKLFEDFLSAFGKVEVSDPRRFMINLCSWAAYNTKQIN